MLNVKDSNGDIDVPTISENWYLKLMKNAKGYTFKREGSFISNQINNIDSIVSIRRSWNFNPVSLYAWYETENKTTNDIQYSIVQMKNADNENNFFPSKESKLIRFYSLGGPGDEEGQVGNNAIDIKFNENENDKNINNDDNDDTSLTVLLSSNSGDPYWSGLQEVLFGGIHNDLKWYDYWNKGWEGTNTSILYANNTLNSWNSNITVYVNDLDFPAGALSTVTSSSSLLYSSLLSENGDKSENSGGHGTIMEGTRGTENMNSFDDLHAFLMGIYASPAGALCTHKNMVRSGVNLYFSLFKNMFRFYDNQTHAFSLKFKQKKKL